MAAGRDLLVRHAVKEAGKAAAKAAEWTERRNVLIVEAYDVGAPNREIARACGLSHTAVAKIIERETA